MKPAALELKEEIPTKSVGLVIGFSGWMDGGEVSTGTMQYLIDKLNARKIATIDPEQFYIYGTRPDGDNHAVSASRPHRKRNDRGVSASRQLVLPQRG